jgi:hypothetical protein
MKFFSVIFSYLSTSPLPSITTPQCNCVRPPLPNSISHVNSSQTPNSPCWPTFSSWSHLNYTLRDALICGIPLGAVCYPSLPAYNSSACANVLSQWTNSSWHASHPVSVDYPIVTNNSCNPLYPNGTSITGDVHAGKKGCAQGAYPVYVANATTASQISVGLKWAKQKKHSRRSQKYRPLNHRLQRRRRQSEYLDTLPSRHLLHFRLHADVI